jgi:hypothetical protein
MVWEQIANELRIWRQQQQAKTQKHTGSLDAGSSTQDTAGLTGAQATTDQDTGMGHLVERSARSCELEAWRLRHHPAWQDVDIPWVIISNNDEGEEDIGVVHQPANGRGSSQYRGVCRSSNGKRWQVQLGSTYIGMYDEEIEAAEAYDKVAIEQYGASTAQLNFPGCVRAEGYHSSKRKVPSERSKRSPHSRQKVNTTSVVVERKPKPKPVGFRIVKSWSELRPACKRLEAPELTTEAKSVLARKMKEHGGEPILKWQVCSYYNFCGLFAASL